MRRPHKKNTGPRQWMLPAVAGVLLVSFLAGSTASYYRLFPYEVIDNASRALKAEEEREVLRQRALKDAAVVKSDNSKLLINTPDAFKGYTLYTPLPSPKYARAFLVDMAGNNIHEWSLPYSKFPAPVKSKKAIADDLTYWFDAHAFPNGDLLAVYHHKSDTPYGAGLVKLDKDSNIIWAYGEHVNHRIDVADDGTIATLIHDLTPPPADTGITFRSPSIISDAVTLLTPDGKEFKRISLISALADSPYRTIIQNRAQKPLGKGDVLHPNSVMILTPKLAPAFPMFKVGQILVSVRNLNLIGVIDPDSGKFIWAATGIWHRQHQVQFSPDGNIIMFDNQGKSKFASRILKVNPATYATQILYEGTRQHPFFSRCVGMQQELPNGDLLITESKRGRIFEVNPQKEIVWQYASPYHTAHRSRPLQIETGRRYGPEELSFLVDKPADVAEE